MAAVQFSALFLLVVLPNTLHSLDGGETRIVGLWAESESVVCGANIALTCRVANMDASSKIVRYYKHLLHSSETGILLTTNRIKEDSIATDDRFSITGLQNNLSGYDFRLNITGTRMEDSGSYSCLIPAVNLVAEISVNVLSSVTTLLLYVNGLLMNNDTQLQFDDITDINLTCVASGGNPQPVINITRYSHVNMAEEPVDITETVASCQVQRGFLPPLLSPISCIATATVVHLSVDYSSSGKTVTCAVKSHGDGWPQLTRSITPFIPGGVPVMTCDDEFVMVRVYNANVHLVCNITSQPPVTDAYISWDPHGLLRPVTRPGWPAGVDFDRDDSYMAYHYKAPTESVTSLQLELSRVFPQMFREYRFTATNKFGSTQCTIQLVQDASYEAVHSVAAAVHSINVFSSFLVVCLLPAAAAVLLASVAR